ncbi:hypothetical protein OUZ56_012616 [Daphnia magna]|uniref:Uncharacterized protein n=1 Tax=Daphnia magna TaxID=35525 RepID=A0ABQ9Z3J2_9CRUS|nr:hypothetical protein OUZ56_012616 [Daphnia magna]
MGVFMRKFQLMEVQEETYTNPCDDEVTAVEAKESEAEAKAKKAFLQRRSLINKEGSKLTTKKCLEIAPCYETIKGVIAGLMRMEPMCNITQTIYETNFNELIEKLRDFLKSKHPSSYNPETTGEKGVLEVGTPIEPLKNGINPYGILILNKDELMMMILAEGYLNYKNIPVTTICEAISKILAMYYVINLNYPAPYGALELIDHFYLIDKKSSRNQAKKKSKKEESTLAMKKFLNATAAVLKSPWIECPITAVRFHPRLFVGDHVQVSQPVTCES